MRKSLFIFLSVVVLMLAIATPVSAEIGHSHETELAIHNCPVCNMAGYFTGTTKTEWGHLWYLYECPNGHKWWSRNP